MDERIKEVDDPIEVKITTGKIRFEKVSFTYDAKMKEEDRTTVLDNVDFEVLPGQRVGIVGQTGSGKSTIMRLLYRFYDITAGRILIDDQDISQMRL